MAIPATLVNQHTPPLTHEIDERWTMAYATALGDHRADYLDTTSADGIVAHPLFSVCPEWAVIVATRDATIASGVPAEEVITSVHATHDVTVHRLIRPGDRLTTSITTAALMQKSPGALAITRLQTVDQTGAPVATTTQAGIYLGVPLDGADVADPEPPPPLPHAHRDGQPLESPVHLSAGAAHVYTECARIWNPIHTDKAVALAAGLPDIILHGTANLAHGVSAVVEHRGDGRPELVRRIAGNFRAMVRLPSVMTVRVWPATTGAAGTQVVAFEVLNEQGEPAVSDGVIVLGEPTHS